MTGGEGRGGGEERRGVTVSHRQPGLHHCGALGDKVRIETVDIVVQRRQQVFLLRGNQGEVVKTGFQKIVVLQRITEVWWCLVGIEQVFPLTRAGRVKMIKMLLVLALVLVLVIVVVVSCLQVSRAGGVNKCVSEKHQSRDWFVS